MKIFATADLHISCPASDQISILKNLVKREDPDVVLIAGDVHDYRNFNPYKDIGCISKDVEIIFCLGNHEFAYRSVKDTFDYYKQFSKPANVHCLDICNYVDICNVRFVGNVLWYDGSLSDRPDVEDKLRNIDFGWLDETIRDFEPVLENGKCIKQIKEALKGKKDKAVLLTHTVPHHKLNRFYYEDPNGVYNIYSGMYDLFDAYNIDVDVSVCGHTHKPAKYRHKNGIDCYNIGNDYHFRSGAIVYDVFEL